MTPQEEVQVSLLDDGSDESEEDLLLLERIDPKGTNGTQYKQMDNMTKSPNNKMWLVILLVVVILGEYL